MAKAYGVGSFFGFDDRVTFLIDANGIVRQVWPKVSPAHHAAEVLAAARALAPSKPVAAPAAAAPAR